MRQVHSFQSGFMPLAGAGATEALKNYLKITVKLPAMGSYDIVLPVTPSYFPPSRGKGLLRSLLGLVMGSIS